MRRPYTFTEHSRKNQIVCSHPRRKFYFIALLLLVFDLFYFFNFHRQDPVATQNNFDYTAYQKEAGTALTTADKNYAELPLLLQNNPAWADQTYGNDSGFNTVRENGCALLSLAMITSFWEKRTVAPTTILSWAKNNYYVPNQGTSWQIFPDYAQQKGWVCDNLGSNWQAANEKMNAGIPLIVSVKPGTFTTTGHIMVITSSNGKIRAYDPNDNPNKRHSFATYTPATFQKEAANYWAIHL